MGAVTFSIDVKLVEFFVRYFLFDCFIETGTFRGDTLELVKPYFPQLLSIEFSDEYYRLAVARFHKDSAINILKGESWEVLTNLVQQKKGKSLFFWLDAHWCEAENTAGEKSQTPLLRELQAIQSLNEKSVLLIDDARLYLCPPGKPHEFSQWPDFDEILQVLHALSDKHKLIVLNDVLVYYPQAIQSDMQHFAHEEGIDWLDIFVKSLEYEHLLDDINAKEQEIQRLTSIWRDKERTLQAQNEELITKESVIQSQNEELITKESVIQSLIIFQHSPLRYWCVHRPKLFLKRVLPENTQYRIRRICREFQPKLGRFDQYSPRLLDCAKQPALSIAPPLKPPLSMSIVTPSYNQAQFLEETIKSVLRQDCSDVEYIVQDGGSRDGSGRILEHYRSQIKHVESCKDRGQADAINQGFQHATGEIMAWLNSDDLLLPGTLAYIANYFLKHPDVDVVYGHRIVINEDDREVGRWVLPPHDDSMLIWADYIPQETLFWRRSIWEKAGGYVDESFQFALDWELLLRFRDVGAKFVRLPRFLGAFRVHPRQKTSQKLESKGFQEMARLRRRIHGREISNQEALFQIRHYLRKHIIYDWLSRLGIFRF